MLEVAFKFVQGITWFALLAIVFGNSVLFAIHLYGPIPSAMELVLVDGCLVLSAFLSFWPLIKYVDSL